MMFHIRCLLGYVSQRRSPWKNSTGIIASCTKRKVPSFKATDGSQLFIAGSRFEAYLRRLAEEILDVAVRNVIDELDRIMFEEEESVVISE